MKYFALLGLLLLPFVALWAQSYSPALYVEVANKAVPWSVNYERPFAANRQWTCAFRLGLGVTKRVLAVPLGVHAYTAGNDHHFEASLGIQPYIYHFHTMFKKDGKTDTFLYLVPGLGYRYQPRRGRWLVRVGLHPMLFMDPPSTNIFDVQPSWVLGGSAAVGLRL